MSIRGEHADGHPVYGRQDDWRAEQRWELAANDGLLELPASELIAEHQGHGMPATYFGDCEQCHAQMPHEHAV